MGGRQVDEGHSMPSKAGPAKGIHPPDLPCDQRSKQKKRERQQGTKDGHGGDNGPKSLRRRVTRTEQIGGRRSRPRPLLESRAVSTRRRTWCEPPKARDHADAMFRCSFACSGWRGDHGWPITGPGIARTSIWPTRPLLRLIIRQAVDTSPEMTPISATAIAMPSIVRCIRSCCS